MASQILQRLMQTTMLLAAVTAVMTVRPGLLSARPADSSPELRLHGVKLKVADMDVALDFYCSKMGFGIRSRSDYPYSVTLKNDGMALVLSQAKRNRRIDYPNESQTILVFQANDLMATVADLKSKGVSFLLDEPMTVGVGIAQKFRDPFGNVHSLLEHQITDVPAFEEPRIYNVGYYLPALQPARDFYVEKLDFGILTMKYYPPVIPLKHRDGSLAVVLHERPDLRLGKYDYQKDSQTIVLFETENLDATMERLRAHSVALLHDKPQISPQGRYIAFIDHAGMPAEVVQPWHPARLSELPPGIARRTPHTVTASAEAAQPRAEIGQLAWLAGHWQGAGFGGLNEELWSQPIAGAMMGSYRLIKDGKTVFYEMLNIVEQNNSLVMRLKHFSHDFVGWESKAEHVSFPLVHITETAVYFDALTFYRQNEDRLTIFLAMTDRQSGEVREQKFVLQRVSREKVAGAGS